MARLTRRFDEACAPFDRLCAAGTPAPALQAALTARREATNPRALRQLIYALLDQLAVLPLAAPEL